jgi:predicted nucleic acid-binding protein
MTVVVDASVLVKVFVEEPGSEAARRLIERSELLIAPAHAFGEVGEVLARRLKDGKVTRAQVGLAIVSLPGLVAVVGIEAVLGRAIDMAVETGASVYDTIYVATAAQKSISLVTADGRLIDRLRGTEWAELVRALDANGSADGGGRVP